MALQSRPGPDWSARRINQQAQEGRPTDPSALLLAVEVADDVAVGRLLGVSADVAAHSIGDSGNLTKRMLDAPKTAGGESRFL